MTRKKEEYGKRRRTEKILGQLGKINIPVKMKIPSCKMISFPTAALSVYYT